MSELVMFGSRRTEEQDKHKHEFLQRLTKAQARPLVSFGKKPFAVPLSWVATTELHPHANLGDALSPIIVSVLAGKPARMANFDEDVERLAAVGTIGHNFKNGYVHFWGTGLDATRNPVESPWKSYIRPPATKFQVHAVRGAFTAAALTSAGIDAPAIYGDPVWFLPRVFDKAKAEAELGVIVHISELEEGRAAAAVKKIFKRYAIPEALASSIRIINTYTDPTVLGLETKVAEITSCKRILSTSLHGMVIAETYGIPCAWFAPFAGGEQRIRVEPTTDGLQLDHRLRDFYSGVGSETVLAYCQDRAGATNWEQAIGILDRGWKPLTYDGRGLFDAFPLPLAVRFEDQKWYVNAESLSSIKL